MIKKFPALRYLTIGFALILSVSPNSLAEEPMPKLPIGMNLSAFDDWQTGYPFKNLMWGARPWITRNPQEGGPFETNFATKIPLDENGYPTEVPFTPEGKSEQVVFTLINKLVPPGVYILLYDGEGEIGPAVGTKVLQAEPGRVTLELTGGSFNSDYQGFTILRSAKGNHIRNIRILKEADEKADFDANPFREDFLEYCKQWHVLRFMDWQATNDSLEDEWKDRKKPTFYTMVGRGGDAIGLTKNPASEFRRLFSGGVALEILIKLANLTKVNPWFCVPHRATPEYMREMAQMIKTQLDPSLKAYIEYSNELWNWQFQQAQWMLRTKIAADRLAGQSKTGWKGNTPPAEFPLDNGTVAKDGGADHPERTAALARRCFEIFEEVFQGEDARRIVRVIGVQQTWPDTIRRTVRWVMDHGGADAVSPAGYFWPDKETYAKWEAAGASLTAEDVISDMNTILDTKIANYIQEIGGIADQFKLQYVVYEGGQHIQPKDQQEKPYMSALKEVQFSKGLYDCYIKNFRFHEAAGCDLFAAFASFSEQGKKFGSWGHQEYLGQPRDEIPKFGALLDVNIPKASGGSR